MNTSTVAQSHSVKVALTHKYVNVLTHVYMCVSKVLLVKDKLLQLWQLSQSVFNTGKFTVEGSIIVDTSGCCNLETLTWQKELMLFHL